MHPLLIAENQRVHHAQLLRDAHAYRSTHHPRTARRTRRLFTRKGA